MTPVCVLRSGGDFRPQHVQVLARHVPGLVCLSDVPMEGVAWRPLLDKWPGWWAKMEAYGPAITGDMLLMDLDTIVIRTPEIPAVSTVLPDFYRPMDRSLIGSGFVFVSSEDRARIWAEFTANPRHHMARCRTRTCWGDQGFLAPFLAHCPRWGANVVSWKVHCKRGIPSGADVICFHGKPRPWDVPEVWTEYAKHG